MREFGEDLTVELYGVPRHRAGRAEVRVVARTVREALAAVVAAHSSLGGIVIDDRLAPQYLLSIDGGPFVTDLGQPLRPGERLLILSADAGG